VVILCALYREHLFMVVGLAQIWSHQLVIDNSKHSHLGCKTKYEISNMKVKILLLFKSSHIRVRLATLLTVEPSMVSIQCLYLLHILYLHHDNTMSIWRLFLTSTNLVTCHVPLNHRWLTIHFPPTRDLMGFFSTSWPCHAVKVAHPLE
jgi:hypothetical protein